MNTTSFKQISKEQFFATVGKLNVHPRCEREFTNWVDLNTHAVIGISSVGYANAYTNGVKTPETFMARVPS